VGRVQGSLLNKLILVPVALALKAFAPWALGPVLIVGGTYLCFEAFEKVLQALPSHKQAAHEKPATESESDKIKGAIRTDFILSAEIIMIALAAIGDAPLSTTIPSVALLAVGMTVFVYGLVAVLVKFDDMGLALTRRDSAAAKAIGRVVLAAAPALMRLLALVGTVAMFAVGGGLLVAHIPVLEHLLASALGDSHVSLLHSLADAAIGVVLGAVTFAVMAVVQRFRGR
jgi:predicted DNA repair protein MutK